MNLDSHVGQLGQFAEEARIAPGHHTAVFIPEIKHVAKQVYGGGLGLYAVEEAHQAPFVHAAVVDGERAKMCVGKEIHVFHTVSF